VSILQVLSLSIEKDGEINLVIGGADENLVLQELSSFIQRDISDEN